MLSANNLSYRTKVEVIVVLFLFLRLTICSEWCDAVKKVEVNQNYVLDIPKSVFGSHQHVSRIEVNSSTSESMISESVEKLPSVKDQISIPAYHFHIVDDERLDHPPAYLTQGDIGILIFNLTTMEMVSTIATHNSVSHDGYNVKYYDGFVYLADGQAGFKIFDASNPYNLVLLSSINTRWAHGIAYFGGHVFVGDHDEGLKIFEVSDKTNPVLVWNDASVRVLYLTVNEKDSLLYAMISESNKSGMKIFNISDPSNPTEIGTVDTLPGVWHLYWDSGKNIVVLSGSNGGGAYIYDVSDPTNPTQSSHITYPNIPSGWILWSYVSGCMMYIAACRDGIYAYDISDISDPKLQWSKKQNDALSYTITGKDNYLYVGDLYKLTIMDIGGQQVSVQTNTEDCGANQFVIDGYSANGQHLESSCTFDLVVGEDDPECTEPPLDVSVSMTGHKLEIVVEHPENVNEEVLVSFVSPSKCSDPFSCSGKCGNNDGSILLWNREVEVFPHKKISLWIDLKTSDLIDCEFDEEVNDVLDIIRYETYIRVILGGRTIFYLLDIRAERSVEGVFQSSIMTVVVGDFKFNTIIARYDDDSYQTRTNSSLFKTGRDVYIGVSLDESRQLDFVQLYLSSSSQPGLDGDIHHINNVVAKRDGLNSMNRYLLEFNLQENEDQYWRYTHLHFISHVGERIITRRTDYGSNGPVISRSSSRYGNGHGKIQFLFERYQRDDGGEEKGGNIKGRSEEPNGEVWTWILSFSVFSGVQIVLLGAFCLCVCCCLPAFAGIFSVVVFVLFCVLIGRRRKRGDGKVSKCDKV